MAVINTEKNITTHIGQVLSLDVWRNKQVMSDVWEDIPYAVVFDGVKEIEVWNCYGTRCEVDATPEVIAAHSAWKVRLAALCDSAGALDDRISTLERQIKGRTGPVQLRRGDEAHVYKGRKVPVGTKGRVFWIGDCTFGVRVGLELADGSKVFTAIDNVTTEAEAKKVTENNAKRPERKAELAKLVAERAILSDLIQNARYGTPLKTEVA